MNTKSLLLAFSLFVVACFPAFAEILSSSSTHFTLRHEAKSVLPPDELWARLIQPSSWWHPEHTYSGDSQNISFEPTAGGLWLESWNEGSVIHGEVIFVKPRRVLRLNAPFGPLQELGAYTIWTIKLEAQDKGTRVIFEEVSHGPESAKMSDIAVAVDFVKGEAIKRLVNTTKNG